MAFILTRCATYPKMNPSEHTLLAYVQCSELQHILEENTKKIFLRLSKNRAFRPVHNPLVTSFVNRSSRMRRTAESIAQ